MSVNHSRVVHRHNDDDDNPKTACGKPLDVARTWYTRDDTGVTCTKCIAKLYGVGASK